MPGCKKNLSDFSDLFRSFLAEILRAYSTNRFGVSRAVECEGDRLWRETVYLLNLKTLLFLYEMLAPLGLEVRCWG